MGMILTTNIHWLTGTILQVYDKIVVRQLVNKHDNKKPWDCCKKLDNFINLFPPLERRNCQNDACGLGCRFHLTVMTRTITFSGPGIYYYCKLQVLFPIRFGWTKPTSRRFSEVWRGWWNTSWWFQPIWKICSSKWEASPSRGENEQYLSCHHLEYVDLTRVGPERPQMDMVLQPLPGMQLSLRETQPKLPEKMGKYLCRCEKPVWDSPGMVL